jgi:uncharacterized metal-binding protein
VSCGKKMMEHHKFENYKHLIVTDLGLKKGEAPATNENVEMVFNQVKLVD